MVLGLGAWCGLGLRVYGVQRECGLAAMQRKG